MFEYTNTSHFLCKSIIPSFFFLVFFLLVVFFLVFAAILKPAPLNRSVFIVLRVLYSFGGPAIL